MSSDKAIFDITYDNKNLYPAQKPIFFSMKLLWNDRFLKDASNNILFLKIISF